MIFAPQPGDVTPASMRWKPADVIILAHLETQRL